MAHHVGYLSSDILQIYHEVDTQTAQIAKSTGLHCPPHCGQCCHSPKIEISVLEALPLALDIYLTHDENKIMDKIEAQDNNPICVIFDPDPENLDNGRCSRYAMRPLICRLFGYTARKNKYDELEFSGCQVHKAQEDAAYQRAVFALKSGFPFPIGQEFCMQIASLNPQLGHRILPINQAIAEALEFLYWKHPRQIPKNKKHAS